MMFGVLIALGAFCGLLRYLKAPRAVYSIVLGGAALLILAARFALPKTHPFRVNASDDLDGLVIIIFITLLVVGYLRWFNALKMRKQSLAQGLPGQQSEQGFVLIDDDAALGRDVEALLLQESFSLLRRDADGQIAIACKVWIEDDVARLGSIYAPEGLKELLEAVIDECDWRGAKMLVVEMLAEHDAPAYIAAGFVEFGRLETSAGLQVSMKKDLT